MPELQMEFYPNGESSVTFRHLVTLPLPIRVRHASMVGSYWTSNSHYLSPWKAFVHLIPMATTNIGEYLA